MVRKMIHRYLLTALAALCLTGCDQITANMDGVDDYDQLLEEVKPKKKDALSGKALRREYRIICAMKSVTARGV